MKRTVDYSYEQDLDAVASKAIDMSLRVREEDPRRLFDEFANLCEWHPVKAAQLLACFSAFMDPDTTTGVLKVRVAAISADRRQVPPAPKRMEELDFADCGTERQAAKHRRRGESPCAACRRAETEARVRRYNRRAA